MAGLTRGSPLAPLFRRSNRADDSNNAKLQVRNASAGWCVGSGLRPRLCNVTNVKIDGRNRPLRDPALDWQRIEPRAFALFTMEGARCAHARARIELRSDWSVGCHMTARFERGARNVIKVFWRFVWFGFVLVWLLVWICNGQWFFDENHLSGWIFCCCL